MATFLRLLLWTAVVVAPGGVLLAPVLLAHQMRQRNPRAAKLPTPAR